MVEIVNLHKSPYDVYIGRGVGGIIPEPPEYGFLGNPFSVKKYGRQGSIERFVIYFYDRMETDRKFRAEVLKIEGLILGCYCKPKECHGDVIKQWFEEYVEKTF